MLNDGQRILLREDWHLVRIALEVEELGGLERGSMSASPMEAANGRSVQRCIC